MDPPAVDEDLGPEPILVIAPAACQVEAELVRTSLARGGRPAVIQTCGGPSPCKRPHVAAPAQSGPGLSSSVRGALFRAGMELPFRSRDGEGVEIHLCGGDFTSPIPGGYGAGARFLLMAPESCAAPAADTVRALVRRGFQLEFSFCGGPEWPACGGSVLSTPRTQDPHQRNLLLRHLRALGHRVETTPGGQGDNAWSLTICGGGLPAAAPEAFRDNLRIMTVESDVKPGYDFPSRVLVFVDGEAWGETPAGPRSLLKSAVFSVPPGKHRIRLEKWGEINGKWKPIESKGEQTLERELEFFPMDIRDIRLFWKANGQELDLQLK